MTVAAPRFIPRAEWLAGIKGTQTASGDAGVWRATSFTPIANPAGVFCTVIHWPGGNGHFAKATADPFGYVQTMQVQYRQDHQFDLGYGYVVTPNGWVFEARGLYRQASQDEPGNTLDENAAGISIQLACDLDGKVTDAQVQSVWWLIESVIRPFFPTARQILGHKELGNNSTECPGTVLLGRIHAGDFEPEEHMTDAEMNQVAAKVRTALVGNAAAGATVQSLTVDALMAEPVSTPWAGAGQTRPFATAIFYILRNSSAVYLGEPLTGSTVVNPSGFFPRDLNAALVNQTKALVSDPDLVAALDTANQKVQETVDAAVDKIIAALPSGGGGTGVSRDQLRLDLVAALQALFLHQDPPAWPE